MNAQRMVALARWIAAAAALAGIVLVYHRWLHVNPTTVALTLLLYILALAANWGLRYAVVVSVVATLSYNYFFLPPLGTLVISDPQNWLALLAFLATAVIASRLSARIRAEADRARSRQRETEMLFHLSRELLQTDKVVELINAVPGSIALVSDATSVLLYLLEGDRTYRAGDTFERPPAPASLKELATASTVSHLDHTDRVVVPLRAGVKPRGLLLLAGVHLSDQTLEALGGLVSISIDRAQALEDVTRSEAAKESERLRSVMLDSITHELRTPLTAIKAAVTTLLAPSPVSLDDTRELLTVVDEESDRLNHLVSQAVEMAQLDSQEIHMRTSPHTLGSLIESIDESCPNLLSARELRLDLPPDLPRVQADPAWVVKVLCNLLDNAIKYSPVGTPVVLSADLQADMVRISVADRGMGIDSAALPMIFDKFYRAPGGTERISGTGMGLAICRAIVQAQGGSIQVVSQPGQGSVFSFTLPTAP